MRCFLKCYYGYKNLGDELLFFGVIEWIISTYHPTHITVEVWDIQRRTQRLDRHQQLIDQIDPTHSCQLQALQIWTYPKKSIKADLYIFGWGEVMTDQLRFDRKPGKIVRNLVLRCGHQFFARAGWNYLIEYRQPIRQGKVIRIWWIGKPRRRTTYLLYRLTLPHAVQIVCRDSLSYQLARQYSHRVHQQSDFALHWIHHIAKHNTHDAIHDLETRQKTNKKSDPYVLINYSYTTPDQNQIKKIHTRLSTYPNHKLIYIAMDRHHDMSGFLVLKDHIHNLELYDRTTHDLHDIIDIFANSTAGIGHRLHFLLLLKTLGITYTILSPSQKISKVLESE